MTKYLVFLLITFLATTALAQKHIAGKYIRADNSLCYLVLKSDNTFKYRFLSDLQWDFACGHYEVKGDSILFNYQSDMFDQECSEGMNYTDTSGVILQDAIDKRFRPISARLFKKKIVTLRVGDIKQPETVGNSVYYYKRRKED